MAIVNDLIPKSILSPTAEKVGLKPAAEALGAVLVLQALVKGTKEALHAKPIEGSKEFWRSRHQEELLASAKPLLKSGSEG